MSQKDVARGVGQTEVARQRHHHDCADAASVECVSLDDENGPSQTRAGADRSRQVRPDDVSLSNYHSLDARTRRPASRTKSSGSVSADP